MKQFAVN